MLISCTYVYSSIIYESYIYIMLHNLYSYMYVFIVTLQYIIYHSIILYGLLIDCWELPQSHTKPLYDIV